MQILSAVGKKTMDKKGRFMVEASGGEYYLVNLVGPSVELCG